MAPIPSQSLKFPGYSYKTIEGTIIKEKLGFRKPVEKCMNERERSYRCRESVPKDTRPDEGQHKGPSR